uniref:Uncharacterized protein n=1 Tax=Oryza barthii TaxID=65489 RepID=A0A0D3H079_9ORYZ
MQSPGIKLSTSWSQSSHIHHESKLRCDGGREDDNDDEEGGAYGGNGKGEQAFVILMVSSAAASASTSATVSGSVHVGLAAKNLKLMHEGAQDLNLAFPHHRGRALQSPEFMAFPSLESSSMCNPRTGGGERRRW